MVRMPNLRAVRAHQHCQRRRIVQRKLLALDLRRHRLAHALAVPHHAVDVHGRKRDVARKPLAARQPRVVRMDANAHFVPVARRRHPRGRVLLHAVLGGIAEKHKVLHAQRPQKEVGVFVRLKYAVDVAHLLARPHEYPAHGRAHHPALHGVHVPANRHHHQRALGLHGARATHCMCEINCSRCLSRRRRLHVVQAATAPAPSE